MIGNVVRGTVTITGTRPLLWRVCNPDLFSTGRTEKSGTPGFSPDEWHGTVSFDPISRQLYLPGTYFHACIREAEKYTRVGKSSYHRTYARRGNGRKEHFLIS
jgi:hypothetical protein